jgi:hypothetical protein
MPTQVNTGNLMEHNRKPDSGENESYDRGNLEMNMPVLAEFSPRKELSWLPTVDSHRIRMEKPRATHLGGVEAMTVIELTRD